ncbi:MAG: TetR family transcriptional regulator C-terminal domain-containing protein [Isosphaeraceae bacterium]
MARGTTTRETLLEAGWKLFLERGFNHAGLDSILQAANVPRGSFYHFFGSKEEFGLAVLNRFVETIDDELEEHLGDESLRPLERLRRHGEALYRRVESRQCRNGCLVGNLSQELADQSEAFRLRLDEVFRGWIGRYEACLREAQADGELSNEVDPADLAEFWVCGWQGAILRAKTTRSLSPVRTFLNLMFGYVLHTPRRDVSDALDSQGSERNEAAIEGR